MKLLAIDSSGMVASVALMTEEKLIGEYTINNKKTHSQTLLPMIDDMMKMIGQDINEIDAVAIASGPGSFTGLRIGSATAKGLAFAVDCPIIGVPTMEAIASNISDSERLICPMMDARNRQVFTGLYRCIDGNLTTILEQTVLTIEELCEKINELNEDVMFLGDGVECYRTFLEEQITPNAIYASPHLRNQRASAVGYRAFQLYREGKVETADSHVPNYLRLSQAEREMQERLSKQAREEN